MVDEFRPIVATRRQDLAAGVIGLTLEPVGWSLPGWEPGAHVDVVLPSGLVRQYSLCGPRDAQHYEIAILLEADGRGGSAEVHREVWPGVELAIRGPRNRFQLEPASEYLFFAGGIGITPILAMVEEVHARGLPWRLIYGGRSEPSMAYRERLSRFGDRVTLVPQDRDGLIDVETELSKSPAAQVFVCGPPAMIAAIQGAVGHSGDRQVHVERFTPDPSLSALIHAPGAAFEVQLGLGGPLVAVDPETSILDSLLDAGVEVLFSCTEGTCGSCQTTVLAGVADHRDDLLTDEERAAGGVLICVSRSLSPRLVLDISAPAPTRAGTAVG